MPGVCTLHSQQSRRCAQGEGEIWVSNTRFSADGTPAEQPPSGSRSPLGGGPLTRPRSTGGDYVMTTNATPKPVRAVVAMQHMVIGGWTCGLLCIV